MPRNRRPQETRYSGLIDLHSEARALNFAKALDEWMTRLQGGSVIRGRRLYRRKPSRAPDRYRDVLQQIEMDDLTQPDRAFRGPGCQDGQVETLYRAAHRQILAAKFGPHRPFPEEEWAQRMALLRPGWPSIRQAAFNP